MDEKYKVAISRLGQRMRVAGSAELGGRAGHINAAAVRTLYKGAGRLVPRRCPPVARPALEGRAADAARRPAGAGRQRRPGIWLNLGHGSSGWALSCGSARVLADLMAGRSRRSTSAASTPQRLKACERAAPRRCRTVAHNRPCRAHTRIDACACAGDALAAARRAASRAIEAAALARTPPTR